jgi:hypothetical protein
MKWRIDTMCLSADETNPLCDECFAKTKQAEHPEDVVLCKECQKLLETQCGCCEVTYESKEEGGIVNGVCKKCREENQGGG